jgi:hypothetical protein
MKKSTRILTLALLCVTLNQFTAAAQDENSYAGNMNETSFSFNNPVENIDDPPPVEDTPIDGGIALLLAAGAVYGIKKCRDVSSEKEERLSAAC